MTFNTIADIEKQLNLFSKFGLKQIARNVGVARFYVMRIDELCTAILAIAKSEIAPLPYYKRNIKQPVLLYHQDIVDAVLTFSEASLNIKQ